MKVFFVYAHPNPYSLNAQLKDHAIGALQRAGHEVRISDLYAMKWKAVADADDRADFVDRNGLLVVLDLLAQNLADFVRFNIRHACSVAEPWNLSTKTRSCAPLQNLAHSAARRARISFKRLRSEPS